MSDAGGAPTWYYHCTSRARITGDYTISNHKCWGFQHCVWTWNSCANPKILVQIPATFCFKDFNAFLVLLKFPVKFVLEWFKKSYQIFKSFFVETGSSINIRTVTYNKCRIFYALFQQTIIGGSLSFKYRYVTDEQLAKLRVRSVYCSQSVVHSCVKSPVFAQGRSTFLSEI